MLVNSYKVCSTGSLRKIKMSSWPILNRLFSVLSWPISPRIIISIDHGTTRKKRRPKSVPDPKSWKKNESKRRRLMGETYTGHRKIEKKKTRMVQDTPKQERKLGPICQSKLCSKQKTKRCDQISEQERAVLFDHLWKGMTWPEKKKFVCVMIDAKETQQKTTKGKPYRRGKTYLYNLKVGDYRLPICKSMFTKTLP